MTQTKTLKNIIVIIIILVVVTLLGFYFLNRDNPMENTSYTPHRGTLTGVQTCLPHKNTDGPQTMECAIGMKTDSGDYYSIDYTLISQIPIEVQNGQRFSANGLITPIENLSTDYWQKYNVKGVFSITDSLNIIQ